MGLFDIFKNKKPNTIEQAPSSENIDRSEWTGKDFEFLIIGSIEIKSDFDTIFTPNSMEWHITTKNNWDYYQVDQDEFSYSIEEPGIQMTFNKEIPFEKAKKIADEVIANIIASGQQAELLILDNTTKVYGFD
jgi:hypothetical protein